VSESRRSDWTRRAGATLRRRGAAAATIAPIGARARAALVVASALALGACADGSWSWRLTINGSPTTTTSQLTIHLSGETFVPDQSVRTGGTPSVPYLTCQPGPYSMTWTNATNGASGSPVAAWTCSQDYMTWVGGPVPLAPGSNTITVTMTDGRGSAQAAVVVVRN